MYMGHDSFTFDTTHSLWHMSFTFDNLVLEMILLLEMM